jgi:hypothetical protein
MRGKSSYLSLHLSICLSLSHTHSISLSLSHTHTPTLTHTHRQVDDCIDVTEDYEGDAWKVEQIPDDREDEVRP